MSNNATSSDSPELKSARVYANSVTEAVEICYERGWTDGIPVVPPTEEAVTRAIEYLGRNTQESLGVVPPKNGIATIEKIVINSIMGGCRPQHVPVVIAALEGMLEKDFNLNGIQATTHCISPLAIVTGPIVKELGFNAGDGVFGGGSRSNAAVGRAIRLIMWNIGGAFPGEIDRATLGQPGKYCYCIAENSDGNPWQPMHVEAGLEAEDSAVTVFGCEGPHHLHIGSGSPSQTLNNIADAMSTLGNNTFILGGELLVVIGPRAAGTLANGGFSRDDIRKYLFENARVSVARSRKRIPLVEKSTETPTWPKWLDLDDPQTLLPVMRRPEDINLVVAGGWGGPASFCAVCPGWGYMGGQAQTKRITVPEN